jgi:hypothetical protein
MVGSLKVFVVDNQAYLRQNGKFQTILSKTGYSRSIKFEFTLTDGNKVHKVVD